MPFRRSPSDLVTLLLVCLLMSIAIGEQHNATLKTSAGKIARFDTWITWDDGSKEHVVLGIDGFFVLNGRKKRLLGLDLGTTGLQRAFWDSADLEIVDKELAYLQSTGVRLITLDLFYVGLNNELSRYSPILNLLRSHKMLVFPVITGKSLSGFDNLTLFDFPICGSYGNDSMGNWAIRWVDVVKNYENVIAISAENELDCPNPNQDYSGDRVSLYLDWLKNVIRSRTNLPITSKLYYTVWSNLEVKRAILAEGEFPTDTDYSFNTADHENRLNRWTTFLIENNKSSNGWWIGEINKYKAGGDIDASNFNAEFIEQSFNHGASVVCLWTMNKYQDRSAAFFDSNGNPIGSFKQNIVPYLSGLQLPVS